VSVLFYLNSSAVLNKTDTNNNEIVMKLSKPLL
jgi:hypothetical protein